MTTQEIRQLGEQQLKVEVEKTRKDLLKTRFSIVGGHSKETHQVKKMKKHLARLLTIEREMPKEKKVETAVVKAVSKAKPKSKTVKTIKKSPAKKVTSKSKN